MCKEIERLAKFYGVSIVDYNFPNAIRGVYHNGVIGINKDIVCGIERRCLIACKMGRHLICKNKCIFLSEEQENITALHWAVSYLMPLSVFCDGEKFGNLTHKEFAEHLRVTPQFLATGVELYKNIFGNRVFYHDCIIDFENNRTEYLAEVGA